MEMSKMVVPNKPSQQWTKCVDSDTHDRLTVSKVPMRILSPTSSTFSKDMLDICSAQRRRLSDNQFDTKDKISTYTEPLKHFKVKN